MVKYGLIGKTLKHSFSPSYFKEKFSREGIDASYDLYEIPEISNLMDLVKENPALRGLNVTIPYKVDVFPFLDEISPEAKRAGAVNVIKIIPGENDFKLSGFNSDIIGFRESLKGFIADNVSIKALILGTGGASKAVAVALEDLRIPYRFVSRTPGPNRTTYETLSKDIVAQHKLIVNTTPLGMFPDINDAPPFPYHYLDEAHFCYDLIYNPPKTKFMDLSSSRGAKVKNGQEMLELQAEASWKIWNNEI